jgi:hypothetical protein
VGGCFFVFLGLVVLSDEQPAKCLRISMAVTWMLLAIELFMNIY